MASGVTRVGRAVEPAAAGRDDGGIPAAMAREHRGDDRDAWFGAILREHGAGLSRVAACYARGAADRDDLLQDIGLAIWQALPGFRRECSERTFVYRIAHNRGINAVARARSRAVAASAAGDADGASAAVDAVPDERADPEARLGAERERDALMRAIGALPVAQRAVLTLALEEFTHEEIGEVLGITANNVAVRLSRAREALRARLFEARGEAKQRGGR